MASEVDICNEALANLGDSATVASISPPEGSAQSEHCQVFYPMARDTLLEMHDWNFATKRVLLAAVDNPSTTWAYAYSLPSNMLAARAVLTSDAYGGAFYDGGTSLACGSGYGLGYGDESTMAQPFTVEAAADGSGIILTNQAAAVLRYTERTTDTSKFSATFRRCLACSLSSMLAGPVIKGDAGASAAARWQMIAFGRDGMSGLFGVAKTFDANQKQTNVRDRHQAPWITMR